MNEQRKRGGWNNPASADNGAKGGRIRTRYTLSRPAAILLRTLTQSRHGRRDVTDEELTAVLEDAIRIASDQRLSEIEA